MTIYNDEMSNYITSLFAHNAFRSGTTVDNSTQDEYTAHISEFNRRLAHDTRLVSTIFPAGDGTLVVVNTGLLPLSS